MVDKIVLEAKTEFSSKYAREYPQYLCHVAVGIGRTSPEDGSLDAIVLRVQSEHPLGEKMKEAIESYIPHPYNYKGRDVPVLFMYTRISKPLDKRK